MSDIATAKSLARDLHDLVADFGEGLKAGVPSSILGPLRDQIQQLDQQLRDMGFEYHPQTVGLISPITEACWKGYHKEGMKTMFGKRYPNCVKNKKTNEDTSEAELEENLRDWFKDKWVRFGPDGKIRGQCARGSAKEGKPKCLPQSKAHALGKKGRASAAAKKRREDPNPERRGKARNVATKVNKQ